MATIEKIGTSKCTHYTFKSIENDTSVKVTPFGFHQRFLFREYDHSQIILSLKNCILSLLWTTKLIYAYLTFKIQDSIFHSIVRHVTYVLASLLSTVFLNQRTVYRKTP